MILKKFLAFLLVTKFYSINTVCTASSIFDSFNSTTSGLITSIAEDTNIKSFCEIEYETNGKTFCLKKEIANHFDEVLGIRSGSIVNGFWMKSREEQIAIQKIAMLCDIIARNYLSSMDCEILHLTMEKQDNLLGLTKNGHPLFKNSKVKSSAVSFVLLRDALKDLILFLSKSDLVFEDLHFLKGQLPLENCSKWLNQYAKKCYKKSVGLCFSPHLQEDTIAVGCYICNYRTIDNTFSCYANNLCDCFNKLDLYDLFYKLVKNSRNKLFERKEQNYNTDI